METYATFDLIFFKGIKYLSDKIYSRLSKGRVQSLDATDIRAVFKYKLKICIHFSL